MSTERDILAKIRTLLAIERNFLAEERTALAEFRTGITLALVAPPSISLLTYLFQIFPITRHPVFEALIYPVFIVLTIIGISMSVMSRARLQTIRRKIQLLKDRQLEVMKDSDAICSLLEDCVTDTR